MKVQVGATGVLALGALAAAAGVAYLAWTKGPAAVKGALNAVNPLNHDNVFATSVNDYGATIVTTPDGNGKNADGSWSLGGWLRDVTSDDDERIKAMLSTTPQNAARADVERVERATFTGGATGSW